MCSLIVMPPDAWSNRCCPFLHLLYCSYPERRTEFYEQLEDEIRKVCQRTLLLLAGDFNAKTESAHIFYQEVGGKHGKGHMDSNELYLVERSMRNEMILTNTQFYHKMAHRKTWVCPERQERHRDRDGNFTRNPSRNQIDYTLIRKCDTDQQ